MPSQFSVEAEEKAIITILDGASDISMELLGLLSEDHLGTDEAQQCFIRINSLIKNNHQVPSRSVFCEDVTLTDEARSFLKDAQSDPIVKREDVVPLFNILDFHRKYRVFLRGIKSLSTIAKDDKLENMDSPVSTIEQLLLDLRSETQQTQLVVAGDGDNAHADEVVQRILSPEDTESRIYTGFGYFDKMCGGFRKPSVVVVSATTGGGKSCMRTQLCKNMYMDQKLSTCIMSMEMSEEEEMVRLLSNISQVPFEKIERHQMSSSQQSKVLNAWEQFKQVGRDHGSRFIFWVPQGSGVTAHNIITFLKPLNLDVIVVDYIGLLASSSKDEAQWQALGDMVREFKVASAVLKCCFIVLAQFDGDNNRIKYSRAIQEHANILWAWSYGEKEQETGIVNIQQIKNRNARSNIDFRLHFQFETMTITDYQGDPSYTNDMPAQKPFAPPPKAPPKDFKDMKKQIGKFNKEHTYKPAMTPDNVDHLSENDE